MKKLSRNETIWLIVLIFLIAGVLYYNYYFMPFQKKMDAVNVNIMNANAQLDLSQDRSREILRAKDEIQGMKKTMEGTISDIPNGVDEAELLVLCSQALQDLGTNIAYEFDPQVESFEFYQVNYVTIGFNTGYAQLLDILGNFKQLKYRNHIIDMQVEYSPKVFDDFGPQPVTGSLSAEEIVEGQESEAVVASGSGARAALYVKMRVEFFSFPGNVDEKAYDFLTTPIGGGDLFMEDEDLE